MIKKDTSVIEKEAGLILSNDMQIYGTEVNCNRAIPRIEDGLKPVQRFIIWAMHDLNAKNFMKSARISGAVIADWSPHGEASTYEALVNMVHDRLPLIEGQGNFGNSLNISAASSRYTEARMSAFTRLFISDMPDLNIVKKALNYDDRREYPVFLPMRLPLLLLNGAEGMGLALSTRIPSQNVGEIIKCLLHYLQTDDIRKSVKFVKGPDYGSGKLLSDAAVIKDVYDKGDGTLEYECIYTKSSISGVKKLVITGFCPRFNPEAFLQKCESFEEDVLEYARNESGGKNGNRIVLAYTDDALFDKYVMPLLKKKINYKFNLLVSDGKDGVKPVSLNLANIITKWVDIRKDTIKRTLEAELKVLSSDIEKEEGKILAIDALDKLFAILKSSENLLEDLMKKMRLTKLQAETVMGMQVSSLQKLSKPKVEEKIKLLNVEVGNIKAQLGDISEVLIQQIKDIEKWLDKNHPELLKRGTLI